jgi:hypothetical protein
MASEIIREIRINNANAVNCYPGLPSKNCYDLAIFISLSSTRYIKGTRGHLDCRKAIEKVVQHMQGNCKHRSKYALLLVDSWNVSAYDEWMANLQQISRHSIFEIYLMTKGNISRIYI